MRQNVFNVSIRSMKLVLLIESSSRSRPAERGGRIDHCPGTQGGPGFRTPFDSAF